MRKHILVTLLALVVAGFAQASNNVGCSPCKILAAPTSPCGCKAVSQTFLTIRPLFDIASPEYLTLWRDRIYAKEDGCIGAVQVVPFASWSVDDARIAAFFGPTCKTVLLVAEDSAQNPDIISTFFNIATVNGDFKSQISFAPRHKESGVGLTWRKGFTTNWCNKERNFWFEISAPLTHVRNTLGFCENVINDGGGPLTNCGATFTTNDNDVINQHVANMTQAFMQTQWHAGRINANACLSATRLANVDVLVGYETACREHCNLESYIGVTLPAGNRVRSYNMFEPIVGLNHHIGAFFGSNANLQVWQDDCKDRNLWFEFSLYGCYLLQNCQRRLLDLKGKPWSRFMRVYKNADQAQLAFALDDPCLHTPGVDVFAVNVHVKPGFQRTINTGLVYNSGIFQGELGYNFYARESECVSFRRPWQEGPALASALPDSGGHWGTTDSVQVINNLYGGANLKPVSEYNENVIQQCDFDLDSAAQPSTITHTLYGSAGWEFDTCYPTLIGIGGSYEFSHDNAGINRFVVWGKLGLSY